MRSILASIYRFRFLFWQNRSHSKNEQVKVRIYLPFSHICALITRLKSHSRRQSQRYNMRTTIYSRFFCDTKDGTGVNMNEHTQQTHTYCVWMFSFFLFLNWIVLFRFLCCSLSISLSLTLVDAKIYEDSY